jgi:outer membrane protein assembly factor BamE (lipoprotein component of BamABCDE complex)
MITQRLKTIALITSTAILITACASAGKRFDEEKFDSIKEGISTKAQVQDILGKPNSTLRGTADDKGCGSEQWIYSRAFMVAFFGGSAKELVVKYDQAGKVCNKTLKETSL